MKNMFKHAMNIMNLKIVHVVVTKESCGEEEEDPRHPLLLSPEGISRIYITAFLLPPIHLVFFQSNT